jgi:hypothetical protein
MSTTKEYTRRAQLTILEALGPNPRKVIESYQVMQRMKEMYAACKIAPGMLAHAGGAKGHQNAKAADITACSDSNMTPAGPDGGSGGGMTTAMTTATDPDTLHDHIVRKLPS